MKKLSIFVTVILGVLLASCVMPERGTIEIVSPAAGVKSHAAADQPITVPISISSTFDTAKVVSFYQDGIGPLYECIVQPNTVTQCPEMPVVAPGVHTFTASMVKNNGEIVTAEVLFEWAPYSSLDLVALSIDPSGESLTRGYLLMTAGIMVASVLALTALFGALSKGNPKAMGFGAVLAFFMSLVLLAIGLATADSVGAAQTVASMIGGIIVLALLVFLARGYKHGQAMIVTANGDRASFSGTALDGSDTVPKAALEAPAQIAAQMRPAIPAKMPHLIKDD